MSDFITDIEQQYEVYCKIAEEYGFIDLNAKRNGFLCTTKSNEFNAGWIAFTGAVAAVRDEQQAKINDSEAALKEALAWVEDLKRERDFLQKKCAERADRIDAVKAIMNDYYTGSYDESTEMAGLISAALDGEHE